MPSLSSFKKRFSIFQPSASQTDLTSVGPEDSVQVEPEDEGSQHSLQDETQDGGSEISYPTKPPKPQDEEDGKPKKEENVKDSCGNRCLAVLISNNYLLGLYVFLAILLVAGLPFLITYFLPLDATPSDAGVCSVNKQFRFECFPDVHELTPQECDDWNCCWLDKVADAQCFHRFPSQYRLNTTVDQELPSSNSTLQPRHEVLQLEPLDYLPNLPGYGKFYPQTSRMTMVVDKVNSRYLRTRLLLNPTNGAEDMYTLDPGVTDFHYEVLYNRDFPRNVFNFRVSRIGANESLFSLNNGGGLVLSENYTEATILLPSSCSIFGLGFGNHKQLRHTMAWNAWTLFSNYTDFSEGSALYGAHPIYLCVEKDGLSHGVFFNNSYLMEARLQPAPAITFRTVGGDLDFHIVLGPRPMDVIAQLSEIPEIGRPAMPPYWALGYHICPTTNKLDTVASIIQNLEEKGIPFESSCIDADIWRYWQIDPKGKRVKEFQRRAQELKGKNRKTLIVTFPQVLTAGDSGNATKVFRQGFDKDIYLKGSNGYQKGLFNWDSAVAYPDPTNPATVEWMANDLLGDNSNFDGFLLHWNTPLDRTNRTEFPCTSSLEHPPYMPSIGMASMSEYTLCMDVRYHSNDTHASMQNQYGRRHAQFLRDALVQKNPTKRPFLVSLSTHTGIGATAGHWGGEYLASWDGLKNSLVNVLEASLYLIPMSGVPIGGNTGYISSELWTRWFQLGAFYPLALSYYDVNDGDRNPTSIKSSTGTESVVHRDFALSAIRLRYNILPYLYTLFHEAATLGRPVARPMFFEFPENEAAQLANEQFMLGSSLMVVPSLQQNSSTVSIWVRLDVVWYEVKTGSILEAFDSWMQLSSPQFQINVFLRSGHIIPIHDSCNYTYQCRQTTYTLLVGLDCESSNVTKRMANEKECIASGNLYLDDGESISSENLTISFTVSNNTLVITPETVFWSNLENKFNNDDFSTTIQKIRVYGIYHEPENVIVDGKTIYNSTTIDDNNGGARYTLTIMLNVNMTSPHYISWH